MEGAASLPYDRLLPSEGIPHSFSASFVAFSLVSFTTLHHINDVAASLSQSKTNAVPDQLKHLMHVFRWHKCMQHRYYCKEAASA